MSLLILCICGAMTDLEPNTKDDMIYVFCTFQMFRHHSNTIVFCTLFSLQRDAFLYIYQPSANHNRSEFDSFFGML